MVIVMKVGAEQQSIDAVIAQIRELNYTPHPIQGTKHTVIAAIGDERGKHELLYPLRRELQRHPVRAGHPYL